MKKALLVIALILSACVNSTTPVPPETIRNPQCFNSHAIKIFQFNEDISLVQTMYCYPSEDDTKTYRKCNAGTYLQDGIYAMDLRKELTAKEWKEVSKEIYDGYTISFGKYCLVKDGNYSYNNTAGTKHTVMKLKMVESQIPNPEYEKWKAEQDAKKVETNTENK